jgi:protein STE50
MRGANFLLAAENNVNETATQEDIARIIQSIRLRDERIIQAENELKRMSDAYQRLREELLPVFRLAKDKSQPLPNVSPEFYNHDISNVVSPPAPQEPAPKSSLSRTFSKKLFLGSTPKNNSPTHIPQSIPENKTIHENSLDPSAAAMAASTHLTASMSGGSQPSTSPNQISIPSPTSPAHFHQSQPLPSRSYREGTTPNTDRSLYAHAEDALDPQRRTAPTPTPSMNRREVGEPPVSASSTTSSNKDSNTTRMGNSSRPDNSTDSAAPSVEIFKSFRVSMDDPCYKVLPAALKKYNINADWRQYALYIVYGDQERCLGLEERPLILFKQLDKEGKKPMFMLRRHAQPAEGYNQGTGAHSNEPAAVGTPGYSGGLGSSTMPGGRPAAPPPTSQIHLPGGVL